MENPLAARLRRLDVDELRAPLFPGRGRSRRIVRGRIRPPQGAGPVQNKQAAPNVKMGVRNLAVALVFTTLVGCTTTDQSTAPQPNSARSSTAGSSNSAACERGPWSKHCPEADWARSVVANAGYRTTGDTGSALTATDGKFIFHFWAFTPEDRPRDLARALAKENYRELPERVAGLPVYSDGTRFVWSTQGLWVWVASVGLENGTPGGTAHEIRRTVLDDLVIATTRTSFD